MKKLLSLSLALLAAAAMTVPTLAASHTCLLYTSPSPRD